jgi:hypothetical protein
LLVVSESRTLLDGIDQFAKSIAKFNAPDVELEALRDALIPRILSRQGCLGGGIVDKKGRPIELRQRWLNLLDKHSKVRVLVAGRRLESVR